MRLDSALYGMEIYEASNLLKALGSNGFHEFGSRSIEFVLLFVCFLSHNILYL